MKKNNILYSFVLLFVILFPACNRGEVFYRFHHIPQGQWRTNDVVIFLMDSLDFRQDKKHIISIELSANSTYPYQDLWLFVEHNFYTDSIFEIDSIQVFLVDEFGKRLGSGVGGLRQLSVPFTGDIALDTAIVYEMRIRHGMRDNPLRGIEKVGVKVLELN
ncbi:MAG: gliding motility lipoprotein GldH [Dysgonamonadaceae bacterium]|jgi:gliding motility-associated lipoprotein GldH|nr:gliding motility lipoprotein GldH [Dysgonamonadaceae bacterium]